MFYEQSEDYRPLFWFQGRPIYVTTALVIFHVAYFIAIALWMALAGDEILAQIALTPAVWTDGQLWRLLTYFSIDPDFFSRHYPAFILYMVVLFFAGKEIEQFIGRTNFIKLYAALLFIPALVMSLLSVALPFLPNLTYLGYFEIVFAVFIAFATLYPGVCIWCRLPLSNFWLAWGCLGLFTLIDVSQHSVGQLVMLWLCSATAFVSIRLFGAGRGLDGLVDWWENRRLARLARAHQIKIVQKQEKEKSIDEILEKISRSGMASLSAQEKSVLERARVELLKRDGR